ncbi:MAG: LacI family DNA-binding transcriptional regulator [Janthinobacterium lividum]
MARERNSVRNITLSDVAAAAGVVPMTVSRYLNQHPNVTDKQHARSPVLSSGLATLLTSRRAF